MTKFNINKVLILVFASIVAVVALSPTAKAIDFFSDPCTKAPSSPVCKAKDEGRGQTNTNNSVVNAIRAGANIVAILGGVVAVIMIIIGGFNFVTSGGLPGGQRAGDASGVKNARTMITNAVIGLVIIAMAWAIIRLVTDKLLKQP